MPQLYSFRRFPYAIRTRMTLRYAGINVELREVVLKNKPAEMLSLSPKGTVPVLQLSKGEVLEESRDIIDWALKQNDPQDWLCSGPSQHQSPLQSEMKTLVDENDGEFKYWLDRYKYSDRYPGQSMERYREQGLVFLHQLEARLNRGGYLFGDTVSWADTAIFPFVRQFAHVDKGWFDSTDLSCLQVWLNAQLQGELFLSVMAKYSPWQAGDEPLYLFSDEGTCG